MDVQSGRVLAAYNLTYAAQHLATPGSTLKPFVLDALIESAEIDAGARLQCVRRLRIGGLQLDCTHPVEPGTLNAIEALAYSCNSYFSNIALRLRDKELESELTRFGLTSRTGLAARETTGVIRIAQTPVQRQLLALGVAGVEVTPLEMLWAYRRLALRLTQPHRTAADAVLAEGLSDSIGYGMAAAARPRNGNAAGKTGTARGGQSGGPQANAHGWFLGFAPAINPAICVVVFIDNASGNDAAAGARHVFEAFFADSARPGQIAAGAR